MPSSSSKEEEEEVEWREREEEGEKEDGEDEEEGKEEGRILVAGRPMLKRASVEQSYGQAPDLWKAQNQKS